MSSSSVPAPLVVGVYHGYELTGSGSNEYTRYICRGLARLGHDVHVLCRDRRPATLPFVRSAFLWSLGGPGGLTPTSELLFLRDGDDLPARETAAGGSVTVHVLPHGPIRPVFVCDKQRKGDVRAFPDLTDQQLAEYHAVCAAAMRAVLERVPVQVMHANHLVYQPMVCADVCHAMGVPYIVFPHGSSIEYVVHRDPRFVALAKTALARAARVISGSLEVATRLDKLMDPQQDAALLRHLRDARSIVGVGTDTSLFRDVGFGKRAAKIANVESFSATFGGKTAAQSAELRAALAAPSAGPAEWKKAVRGYKTLYNHKLPDAEFYTQLAALPWGHRASVAQSPIVMFLGAMTVGKGIQTLVCSFAETLDVYPGAHLVLIGSGSYREVLEALVFALSTGNGRLLDYLVAEGVSLDKRADDAPPEGVEDLRLYLAEGDNRARLLRVSQERRLDRHVHFQGRVNHQLLSNVFPCVDIAVFPSMLTEAYPLVLMESLANGVVPVLPDHSGFSESLRSLREPMGDEFVDSITMPSEPALRVQGLGRVLKGLIADLSDVRALTPKLRQIAEQRYDWARRCEEMVREYRRVALPSQASVDAGAGGAQVYAQRLRADSLEEEAATVTTGAATQGAGGVSIPMLVATSAVSVAAGVLLSRFLGRGRL